jgi:hypothetical protein
MLKQVEVAGAETVTLTLKVLISQIEQQYKQDTTVIGVNDAGPGIDTVLGGWNPCERPGGRKLGKPHRGHFAGRRVRTFQEEPRSKAGYR